VPRRRWNILDTLQGKLVVASALLVVGALVLSSGVFVFLTHGKENQRALDHTIATAPSIHGAFLQDLLAGSSVAQLTSYVQDAAKRYDVRILMFDYSGQVVEDTGGKLAGTQLVFPQSTNTTGDQASNSGRGETWRVEYGGGHTVTLVAPSPALIVGGRRISISAEPGEPPARGPAPVGETLVLPYQLAIVLPESTVARAWLDLLPWLALAAGIALPVATGFALIIARGITRPLNQLTAAADLMAQGTFDIDVSVERRDEVGQLARAFSSMATRVGDTYQEMRMLVANVSHDVKTPLTSILGFAQALQAGVVQGEEESRRAGGVIHEEAERLARRLNDLVYLSELESGQAVLQRDEVDLGILVDSMLTRMSPVAERRGVGVSTELAKGITLSVDRAKLERALENLLDNAFKFTPSGGEVSVHTFLAPGQPEFACIEIGNSAPDVEPEELPRLFERFYRRDRAGAAHSAGTGLGLTIARDLVELHGGTLGVSLQDGEIILTAKMPRGVAAATP
jgi:signal transduction histidine kinase